MTQEHFQAEYARVFSHPALSVWQPCAKSFYDLTELLLDCNAQMNLTAITDLHEILCKHYADSLTAAPYLPQNARVIDVGCGGGFPTLPLAIARPDLSITALDSTAKKLTFVAQAALALHLSVKTLNARAEEAARNADFRQSFDAVVSRAVARLQILCELCLPFLRVGGIFVALKGSAAEQELSDAKNAIARLGGKVEDVIAADLGEPDQAAAHTVILIRKAAPTPDIYPRNFS